MKQCSHTLFQAGFKAGNIEKRKHSESKTMAFERKCYRQARKSQKVTNKELYIKVQPKRNLLQEVREKKL